jgi:hypothetical protein
MTEVKQGNVTVLLPDSIDILPDAGKLTPEAIARHPDKPRRGVGTVCRSIARAMSKDPNRLKINGVTAAELEAFGNQADEIDGYLVDLEVISTKLRQNNFLLDARAHRGLRRVLSAVRAEEKFDPTILALVPELIEYFANEAPTPEEGEEK